MKLLHRSSLVVVFAAGLAGCHHGPTALSADGDTLKAGQTVYAKRAAVACKSKDELQTAQGFATQGDKARFFSYLNGHCGVFEKPESVKILSIEPGTGDSLVVVKDLDDPSAPSELWMTSTSLTVNK